MVIPFGVDGMSPHYNNRSFVNAVIAAHSAGLSTPSPTEDTLDWKPCLSFYIPGPSSAVPGPQELYVYISVGRLQTRKSLVPFPGTGPCPRVPSCSLPCLLRTRILYCRRGQPSGVWLLTRALIPALQGQGGVAGKGKGVAH